MDVSDTFEMPLLREEDMDIAAMNLADIQKTDFKAELLLKDNEDDILAPSDLRSLENVLASVIDMEFGAEPEIKDKSQVASSVRMELDDELDTSGVQNFEAEQNSAKPDRTVVRDSEVGQKSEKADTLSLVTHKPDTSVAILSETQSESDVVLSQTPCTSGDILSLAPSVSGIMSTQGNQACTSADVETSSVALLPSNNPAVIHSATPTTEASSPMNQLQELTKPSDHNATSGSCYGASPAVPPCLQEDMSSAQPSVESLQQTSSSPDMAHTPSTKLSLQQTSSSPDMAHTPSTKLSLQQTSSSPDKTLLLSTKLPIAPPPAHSAQSMLTPHDILTVLSRSPKKAHSHQAHNFPVSISLSDVMSHQHPQSRTPPQAFSLSPAKIPPPPITQHLMTSYPSGQSSSTSHISSMLMSGSVVTGVKPSQEHSLPPSTRISIIPSELSHSPIITSLLSPNSNTSCPKSASMYHSVLTSLNQSNTESSVYQTPTGSRTFISHDAPDSKCDARPSSKSPNRNEISPCSKGSPRRAAHSSPHGAAHSSSHGAAHSSPQLYDRRMDEISPSRPAKDSFVDKPKPPKAHQPSQPTLHLPKQPLPAHSQGSGQHSVWPPPGQLSLVSHHGQHALVSPPKAHSHPKSLPVYHRSPSQPFVSSLLPVESPAYMSHAIDEPDLYLETPRSLSFPLHHINTLTALEAEMILKSTTDSQTTAIAAEQTRRKLVEKHSGSHRHRSPSLLRSSSLPGYYSPSLDLPTYLSPPPLPPSPISPFFPSTCNLSQSGRQPDYSALLSTSVSNIFPRSTFPSYPHSHHQQELGALPYTGALYSSILSRLSPSQYSPSSKLPPSLMPPKASADSSHHHRATKSNSPFTKSQSHEKSHTLLHLPSGNSGHHHPRSSKSPSLSSHHSDTQMHQRYAPATAQLQNLAWISQSSSQSSEKPFIQAGDHNYQKRGLLSQVKFDSHQSPASTASTRTTTSHSLPAASKKAQHESTRTSVDPSRTQGAKRGPKRKFEDTVLEEWDDAFKRRSTRSRNSRTRKEELIVNYQKLMKNYFPSTLLELENDENLGKKDENEMEMDRCDGESGTKCLTESRLLKTLTETEEDDVKGYIKTCLKGHGIIDLIYKYLLLLANKSDCVWYEGISDLYLKLYERLRQHFSVPSLYDNDESFPLEGLKNYAALILTWAELSLNRVMLENGLKNVMSPTKAGQSNANLLGLLGKFHTEDMLFLSSLTARNDALGSWLGEFSLRLYWLKAKQHQLLNETLDAVDCFEIVQELLQDMEKERDSTQEVVMVPNIIEDKVISLGEVKRLLEALQRCKSLEDTQKLYEEGRFDLVVENLLTTFNNKSITQKSIAQRERPSQLLLLLNSLHKLKEKERCMEWAQVSLNEAIQHYKRVPTVQLRQDWAATLVSIFGFIDKIMEEDKSIMASLSRKSFVRLAHNLVAVIEISLDVGDSVTEMPIGSLLPWKILYRVLQFEEQENARRQNTNESKDNKDDDEDDTSRSLTMLVEAHEHLGRHSWCTKDEGDFLLFLMSILQKEMEDKDREDLTFEQCVFCLYGHPNKKGKARHLSDHNAAPITLDWEKAGLLYFYFAPAPAPEFDSYKIKSVTSDVENLLRRIYGLVPAELNPARHVSAISDYIEGITGDVPTCSVLTISSTNDPYKICSQLYYLLGDFYFKNKEPAKAVKFYQLDLVLNCNRLDSWAGLALAKMYQIEQKLNSTEYKIETPIQKKSAAPLRCFKRAVDLQKTCRKLWLEYGSLAYQLHSHASRQIIYKDLLSISQDITEGAKKRKQDMLALAKNNYLRAIDCEGDGTEDDWLTHYMMGKIAEKEGDNPQIYLEHYKQAAICLHEEKAPYPKKIQFASIPPDLALEALEVFYRTHASALKFVLYHCNNEHLPILYSYVKDSLESHFARCEEKQHNLKDQERLEVSNSPKPSNVVLPGGDKHIYHKNPTDHEYSRHKSRGDVQLEGKVTQDQHKHTTQQNNLESAYQGQTSPGKNQEYQRMETKKNYCDTVVINLDNKQTAEVVDFDRQMSGLVSNAQPGSSVQKVTRSTTESSLCLEGTGETSPVTSTDKQEISNENTCKASSSEDVDMNTVSSFDVGAPIHVTTRSHITTPIHVTTPCIAMPDPIKDEDMDLEEMEVSETDPGTLFNLQKSYSNSKEIFGSENFAKSTNLSPNLGVPEVISVPVEGQQVSLNCSGNSESMQIEFMETDESKPVIAANETDPTCVHKSESAPLISASSYSDQANAMEECTEVVCHQDVTSADMGQSNVKETIERVCQRDITSATNQLSDMDQAVNVSDMDQAVNLSDMDQAVNVSDMDQTVKTNETRLIRERLVDVMSTVTSDDNASAPAISRMESEGFSPTHVEDYPKDQRDRTNSGESSECKQMETNALIFMNDQGISTKGKVEGSDTVVNVKDDSCLKVDAREHKTVEGSTQQAYVDGAGDLKDNRGKNCSVLESVDEKWESESKEKSLALAQSDGVNNHMVTVSETALVVVMETDSLELHGDSPETHPDPPMNVPFPKAEVHKTGAKESPATAGKDDGDAHNTIENSAADATNVDGDALPKDPLLLRADIITKCIRGLELCAERYNSHYKSLYRLADVYCFSKNLSKARDLLLGRPDWQEQTHMPAPGLFSERKQSNFFQGLWKIPIEDIDRSGCFASHVHRSVVLLLKVLAELGDIEMLKTIRMHLKRTPDAGKKYLRDAERWVLADEAFLKCIEVVQREMDASDKWTETRREENLTRVYQVWLMGKGCDHLKKASAALLRAFRVMMKGRTDVNRLTEDQAIIYCQTNLSKALTPSTQVNIANQGKSMLDKGKSGQGAPVMSLEKSIVQGQAFVELTRLEERMETEPLATQDKPGPLKSIVPLITKDMTEPLKSTEPFLTQDKPGPLKSTVPLITKDMTEPLKSTEPLATHDNLETLKSTEPLATHDKPGPLKTVKIKNHDHGSTNNQSGISFNQMDTDQPTEDKTASEQQSALPITASDKMLCEKSGNSPSKEDTNQLQFEKEKSTQDITKLITSYTSVIQNSTGSPSLGLEKASLEEKSRTLHTESAIPGTAKEENVNTTYKTKENVDNATVALAEKSPFPKKDKITQRNSEGISSVSTLPFTVIVHSDDDVIVIESD
ncbi:unnamed protein product [Lymnaea stagnalis]|uniref:Calcineurin-binding protein cabin-1 n=1 Tax=Lymnaea stagnalis TaxID=6523 RepID=A0AAV2ICJ6_LYMST